MTRPVKIGAQALVAPVCSTEAAGAPNRLTFPQKCETLASGCIIWTGRLDRHGYGRTSGRLAHRLAYERAVGPIPTGQFVCHSCDNRACINPAHLWLGTAMANALDMSAKGRARGQGKTHCAKGHEYTPENTRIAVTVRRNCKACAKAARRNKPAPNLPTWFRQPGEGWHDWERRRLAENEAEATRRMTQAPTSLDPLYSESIALAVGVGTFGLDGQPKGSGWW